MSKKSKVKIKNFFRTKKWHGTKKALVRNIGEKIVGYVIFCLLITIAGYLFLDVAKKSHKSMEYLTKLNYTTLQMSTFIENIRVYYMLHPEEKETSIEKLIEIGAVPDTIKRGINNSLINPYGGRILVEATKPLENKKLKLESPTFKMSYQGLPRDVCIGLATMDWGDKVRGLLAMAVGTHDLKRKTDTAYDTIDKEVDNSQVKMNSFVDEKGNKRVVRSRLSKRTNVARPGDSYMPAPFSQSAAKSECRCRSKNNCSFALHYTVFNVSTDDIENEKTN